MAIAYFRLSKLMDSTMRPVLRKLSSFSLNPLSSDLNGAHLNYVGGRRVRLSTRLDGPEAGSVHCSDVTEPATGQVICRLEHTGHRGVDQAVTDASSAFVEWSKKSGFERGSILFRAAQIIEENIESIARLEVKDCGKPLWEAKFDVATCSQSFRYFGGLAQSHCDLGQHVPVSNGSFAYVRREPLGVCAAIGAWNFPLPVASWKVAPALACGNTIVYKPSEFTPMSAVVLAEILTEAGLPPGCFNVVQGSSATGNLLCLHPSVSKVSFTGSVATGQKVMAACAQSVKKVTLELGGKSPLIIFEDCDMENAVKATLIANFLSQGQVCSNGTRVYVQRSIASEFIRKLVVATEKLRIGDPMVEGTHVGAMIHGDHASKVLSYIETGCSEGARIACGGRRVSLEDSRLCGGHYISPCVLTDCTDSMKVVKEEIFGPVACVLEFDTQDEILRRANDSIYGLAGGIFTKDVGRAHRVASALQSGTIWINNYNLYPPNIPFGGYKMSGIGRENGLAVIDHYTQVKSVYVEVGDVENPFPGV